VVSKEQRRRQLAREKYQRQQERRVQQRQKARRRTAWIAGTVVVVLAAAGVAWASVGLTSDGSPKAAAASPTPTAAASASASAGPNPCAAPAAGTPGTKQWKSEPKMGIDTAKAYTLKLSTTCGEVDLKLNAAKAPHTVNSFAFLAGQGYFDHTKCHRLVTANIYVLQCGDPQGTGSGGPGYTIPDENLASLGKANSKGTVTYPAGTVAMANTGSPHTGGSQFFLVYKASPLAPSYTPFGTVDAAGMKVLAKIAGAGVSGGGSDGSPNAHVVIDKAVMSAS
jgi:peptidyl-prolyl cis-trans isomerase B (cyclophilin B)